MIENLQRPRMDISEKVNETSLLVIVGEWECGKDGFWKFIVQTNCLAQCLMVSEELTLAGLKRRIQEEFKSEVDGEVDRLSYCAPSEMSMFASGRTPPVSITTDVALLTFHKLRSQTKALNLFVSFGVPVEKLPSPVVAKQNRSLRIINLADETMSSYDSEDSVESTHQQDDPVCVGEKELRQEVLAEVDLDEFIFVSSLANEGSEYRSFFMKCFDAGNTTATYVEGVRRAVKFGPSNDTLELLHRSKDHNAYAAFAYGIFAICSGYYEEGITIVTQVVNIVSWLGNVIEVADTVMAQIADIEPPLAENYNYSYRYPQGDVPNCVHFGCSMDDVCYDCITYWYCHRVMLLC